MEHRWKKKLAKVSSSLSFNQKKACGEIVGDISRFDFKTTTIGFEIQIVCSRVECEWRGFKCDFRGSQSST